MPKPLTPKQARFVAEYLIDLNATQAAIRAGYAKGSADVTGARLLGKARIAAEVSQGKTRQIASAELTAARVLEELRRIALIDTRAFFFPDGNLKPVSELTEEQGAALAGIEVIIKNAKAGDRITDEIHKIKLWDKPRALEMLAKHFALLTEVVRVDDDAARIAKLYEGRKRVAEARAKRRK